MARRVVSVETVIPNNVVAVAAAVAKQIKPGEPLFPQGTIRFGVDALAEIGRSHGGGWDIDIIADAYRQQLGERLSKLRGTNLISSWTGFCERSVARRGSP